MFHGAQTQILGHKIFSQKGIYIENIKVAKVSTLDPEIIVIIKSKLRILFLNPSNIYMIIQCQFKLLKYISYIISIKTILFSTFLCQ